MNHTACILVQQTKKHKKLYYTSNCLCGNTAGHKECENLNSELWEDMKKKKHNSSVNYQYHSSGMWEFPYKYKVQFFFITDLEFLLKTITSYLHLSLRMLSPKVLHPTSHHHQEWSHLPIWSSCNVHVVVWSMRKTGVLYLDYPSVLLI